MCSIFSADGVALGAAATTSQTHVEMIVFIAIMLHKVSALSFYLVDGEALMVRWRVFGI